MGNGPPTAPSLGSLEKKMPHFISLLWAALALVALTTFPSSGTILVTFLHVMSDAFIPHRRASLLDAYWRKPASPRGDIQGMSMCIALVPVLLQSMSMQGIPNNTNAESDWHVYAKLIALCLLSWENGSATGLLIGIAAFFDPNIICLKNGVFVALWFAFYRSIKVFPSLHTVFTQGEWIMVSSMASIAESECCTSEGLLDDGNLHLYVALSGLLGAGVACAVVGSVSRESLPIRLAILVSFPLAGVEMTMGYHASSNVSSDLPFPRCLYWLATFLEKYEDPIEDLGLPAWPRYYWLLYWCAVLLITIPLAPKSDTGTVITRKWFHLVAVLLFTPVTLAAPQLQSLSYAIALAVLMVMECVRRDIPWLHQFYHSYLDNAKDLTGSSTGVDESVIVSHMGLIVGCAAPMWISDCITFPLDKTNNVRLFLQLWGVLSLGVGDAMGAVVGKYIGILAWGQGRTIEGSMAMLLSMSSICLWALGMEQITLWLPAVVFATLVEAFTLQIDNFVLPLAGASIILLSIGSQ
jgi:dolichol kinase